MFLDRSARTLRIPSQRVERAIEHRGQPIVHQIETGMTSFDVVCYRAASFRVWNANCFSTLGLWGDTVRKSQREV